MSKTLVSIGLPVFNGEKYLGQSLESLCKQTHSNLELILSDNGSTDGTQRICLEFAAKDARIRYYRSPVNRGASWNFNQVAYLARGPLFRWASHDDLCAPELVARCVEVMEADPKLSLCYTKSRLIDEHGRDLEDYDVKFATDSSLPHERFHDLISRTYLCNQIYGLVRTMTLRKTPMFGNFIAADIHLLAELSLHGSFFEIPEYLFFRRDHPMRSVKANPNPRDLLAWFSPDDKESYRHTKIKRTYEYIKAISRSPLQLREKILCYNSLGSWVFGRLFGETLRLPLS